MDKILRKPVEPSEDDLEPNYRWDRALPAWGTMGVDFELRVDFDRLRRYRIGRAKQALENSKLGALLLFDVNNIRYVTATKIGEWERDKLCRFALLPKGGEPVLWDFGSAAVHHRLYSPWLLKEHCRAGVIGMRGTIPPAFGLMKHYAEEIASLLREAGVAKEPVGVDIIEPPMMFELEKASLKVRDGQQVMLEAREIKCADEIALLNRAAAMVDGAYQLIDEELKPGVRENDIVGKVNEFLYRHGSDDVEAINAISGERCNPHPHVFSDRVLRPGDPVYYDILHSYMGYRTCYYRCFTIGYASHAMVDAYKRCREYLDAAIELVRPGRTTAEIAAVWPKAEEFGFPNEEACFALQYGHGVGLAIWEKPVISRLVSFEHPHEIKPGMVFALETFWPSTDGWSAARIEEEIVVTPTGHEVITRFPAEELLVAGAHYFTVNGPLPTTRETESAPSKRVIEMIEGSSKAERVGVAD